VLVPLAAVTGTMLVCDAWFDVMTSIRSGDATEAVLEAVFAELRSRFSAPSSSTTWAISWRRRGGADRRSR
jgi:hypothetical protein